MAHARNGYISTSGLKSDVTIVFLDPDFPLEWDAELSSLSDYIVFVFISWNVTVARLSTTFAAIQRTNVQKPLMQIMQTLNRRRMTLLSQPKGLLTKLELLQITRWLAMDLTV